MKNMKKILAIVLVVAIVASLSVAFFGCNGDKSQTWQERRSALEGDAAKTIKIGLITLHDSSSTYDKNFIDALDVAKANLIKAGYIVETVVKSGIDESEECYNAASDLADAGCDMIMADSFGHEDYMIKAAKDYPEVVFCHATGTKAHTANVPNFFNAFASIYEGRYLAGVAAGLKLKELYGENVSAENSVIGYVGAFTYAEVISGYTSFYLGVKSQVENATMKVQFTGSWYDPQKEKEAAVSLINSGCKLISQHADSMGAPTACKENNVPNITYNISTESECAGSYVIATRINWAPYYEYVAKNIIDVKEIKKDFVGTLNDSSVEILALGSAAAEGTQAVLNDVKAKLISGELKVFDTSKFTVDGAAVTSYMADVDSDAEFTPDTEVVSNGVFLESVKRSAPYFDLKIDGITLINQEF